MYFNALQPMVSISRSFHSTIGPRQLTLWWQQCQGKLLRLANDLWQNSTLAVFKQFPFGQKIRGAEVLYFHTYLEQFSMMHNSLPTAPWVPTWRFSKYLNKNSQKQVLTTWLRRSASQVHQKRLEWTWDQLGAHHKVWGAPDAPFLISRASIFVIFQKYLNKNW